MLKLIRSGFRVFFRHNLLSRITLFASALLGAAGGFFGCPEIEYHFFSINRNVCTASAAVSVLLVLLTAVHAAHREQKEGAIRNKIVFGYSRKSICCAYVCSAVGFSFLCAVLYLTPFLLLTKKATVILNRQEKLLLVLTVLMLFLTAAAAGMIFGLLMRRAVPALLAVTALTGLLTASAFLLSAALAKHQYQEPYTINSERTVFLPQDGYIGSPLRETCIILNKLNPAEAFSGIYELFGAFDTEGNRWDQTERESRDIIRYCREITDLTAERNALSGSTDPDAAHRRSTLNDTIMLNANLIAWDQDRIHAYQAARGALDGKPQCMLAVLILMTAAGAAVFQRRNIF